MARMYERAGTEVTAQASAAITADTLSGGAQTPIDIESGGNADGAMWLDVYINVTSAPSTEATCELYMEASPDSTNYAAPEYCPPCAVPTSTGRIHVGPLYDLPRKCKLSIKAVGYGFTADCTVVPRYVADA